jgi:hypothetical protein
MILPCPCHDLILDRIIMSVPNANCKTPFHATGTAHQTCLPLVLMPRQYLRSHISDLFGLGGEIGLECRAAIVAAAASARAWYDQLAEASKVRLPTYVPSARLPQTQVLVGSLFSVAALSHATFRNQYLRISIRLSLTYCIEEQAAFRKSRWPPWRIGTRHCYVRSKSWLRL